MKKYSLALLAVAAAIAITPAALADTFYFSFSGGGINASGTLVGTEIGNTGVYDITGGTIDILNSVFSGPAGSGTFVPGANSCCAGGPATDNLLYLNGAPTYGTYVDFDGMDFTVDGKVVSLWAGDNNYPGTSYSLGYGDGIFYPGTMSVSLTPEPSSLLLLGTGLLGLALLAFRKVKSSGRTQLSPQSLPNPREGDSRRKHEEILVSLTRSGSSHSYEVMPAGPFLEVS